MNRFELGYHSWTALSIVFVYLFLLKILELAAYIRSIIGTIAGITLFFLLGREFFGFQEFLVGIVGVVFVVCHGVVDVDALVIE